MSSVTEDIKKDIKTAARKVVESGRAEATDRIEDVGEKAMRQVDGTADALHKAASDSEGEIPSRLLETLAQAVEAGASRLRDGSLLRDAESFARRNPAVVIGGGLLAGFALTRFARASAPSAPLGISARPTAPRAPAQTVAERAAARNTGPRSKVRT